MIFLGDIACPNIKVAAFNEAVNRCKCFDNEIIVLNLEATFVDGEQNFTDETLFNSKQVLDAFLQKGKKVIVSLANNHMYDYPEYIMPTLEYLESRGVGVFGLCEDNGQVKPYVYEDETGLKHAFFGHCWRLYTQTNCNKVNNIRIVDHSYDKFIAMVTQYIRENSPINVYCFMHWNYDLEKLPFPLHLNVARKLIDNGATAIIGSHSHRPQAAEIYKDKPIVYGLGNFYLPSNLFFSGKLSYPECSKDTYALIISDQGLTIQWFRTDDQQQMFPIVEREVEKFDGEKIKDLSEGLKLSMSQYISYFRKKRLKKLLVPIFVGYTGWLFRLKELFAINRVKLLRKIKK